MAINLHIWLPCVRAAQLRSRRAAPCASKAESASAHAQVYIQLLKYYIVISPRFSSKYYEDCVKKMKDLDAQLQNVAGFLADLNLDINDLDKDGDEEDQLIQDFFNGNQDHEPANDEDFNTFVAKGPMRKVKDVSKYEPYTSKGLDHEPLVVEGFFMDDPAQVKEVLDKIDKQEIDEDDQDVVCYVKEDLPSFDNTGIPALPSTSSSLNSSSIKLLFPKDNGFMGFINVPTYVTIDDHKRKFVLKMPKRVSTCLEHLEHCQCCLFSGAQWCQSH